jgi:hypothetical protein
MRKTLVLLLLVLLGTRMYSQVLGTPVVTWDFANGLPAGWQTGSDSGIAQWEYRGPSTTPSNAVASQGSCAGPSTPPASVTQANGFMIFDSNYWDDPGSVCGGAIGSGADPAPQDAWLTTNPISLSGIPGAVITFQQQYWHFQASTQVQISINGGGTWTTVYNNPLFISPNVEWVSINISTIAGGQPDVRFRFLFSGFYYWWAIDDVTVFVPNENDLLLSNPRYTTVGNSGQEIYQDMMYDQYPVTMLTPFRFSGQITNIGTSTQTGVGMNVQVLNSANSVIYNQNTGTQSFAPGVSANQQIAGTFTPSSVQGDYRVLYNVTQAQTDGNVLNNRDTLDYSVTAFSMARDEGELEDAFVPASLYAESRLRIGNIFESFSNGNSCFSITAALAEGTEVGSIVKGYVYTPTLDSLITETLPYTVNLFDINQEGEENLVTLDLAVPLPLFNDSLYLVMIGSVDGSAPLRVGRSGTSPEQTSFVNYPDELDWFFLLRTPMVRMNVFPNAARPGCTDPAAFNYEGIANVNDGSCRYAGCTIEGSTNYNPTANFDDGSCLLEGCTDPLAVNYNPLATVDDGSCTFDAAGCTDPTAANYNPNATEDDGSCEYPGCTDPLANNFDPQANVNDGSCTYDIPGCTDPQAVNYNSNATVDDGSCQFAGCTNPAAINYDPQATIDDGSCLINGCTDPLAANYNPLATTNDGSCQYPGCTNPEAVNFDPQANFNDGSCLFEGCTNPEAENFDPVADIDDGSCILLGCLDPDATNYDPDANTDSGNCIYGDIEGCTDPLAVNFDEFANVEDGSCLYAGCTNPAATNFNPEADVDDGSCLIPGCTLPEAVNYDPMATVDDGSCVVPGCTIPEAINYNPIATVNDGSCVVPGCTDPGAINYNPQATVNNGTCTYDPVQAQISVNALAGCAPFSLIVTVENTIHPDGDCSFQLNTGLTISGCNQEQNILLTAPGIYSITYFYTENGNTTSMTIEGIEVYAPPIFPVVTYNEDNQTLSCSGCESLDAEWILDGQVWAGNINPISTWNGSTFENGSFYVTVENENGCVRSSNEEFVLQPYFTVDQDSSFCAPFGITLTNLTDPVTGMECIVNSGDGFEQTIGIGASVFVLYENTGTYTASLSATVGLASATWGLPIFMDEFPVPILEQIDDAIVCTNYNPLWQLTWIVDGEAIPFDNQSEVPILGNNYIASFASGQCIASSSITVVGVDNTSAADWNLYPNPASDVVVIHSGEDVEYILIRDGGGREVMRIEKVRNGRQQCSVHELANGLYTVEIRTPTFTSTKRLVIAR